MVVLQEEHQSHVVAIMMKEEESQRSMGLAEEGGDINFLIYG